MDSRELTLAIAATAAVMLVFAVAFCVYKAVLPTIPKRHRLQLFMFVMTLPAVVVAWP